MKSEILVACVHEYVQKFSRRQLYLNEALQLTLWVLEVSKDFCAIIFDLGFWSGLGKSRRSKICFVLLIPIKLAKDIKNNISGK